MATQSESIAPIVEFLGLPSFINFSIPHKNSTNSLKESKIKILDENSCKYWAILVNNHKVFQKLFFGMSPFIDHVS